MEYQPHMTSRELAQRLNISLCTVERWRQRGDGPQYLKYASRVFYRVQDVEAFERAQLFKRTGERVYRKYPFDNKG